MDYKPLDFEEKWIRHWAESGLYRTSDDAKKEAYYVLEMFPYPSGMLHMGHVRNYSIGDALARFKAMNGFRVLHPMGFDSFGLPAENAAIKNGIDPEGWTLSNIESMKVQLRRLGLSYDWEIDVATCKPDYFRWNQWLFIQMYKKGLVYRKKGWVNWDPVDNTVLANEQVIDGKGWRSGAVVEKREIVQWYLKITDYADELLTDIDTLEGWPDRVKTMQRNWIGKSFGATVLFDVVDASGAVIAQVPVFTTRPDTLFGVTYVVLAAEHPLVEELSLKVGQAEPVSRFVQDVLKQSVQDRTDVTRPKQGMALGLDVINPVNGDRCPLYIGDYVLMDYGTGAVMAVPAHDQRDFDFAKTYGLPVRVVIQNEERNLVAETMTEAYVEPGVLVASGAFTGCSNEAAKRDITTWLSEQGKGGEQVSYRLRDWLISRQRYWGTPIPMVYDDEGNVFPVPEEQLPVTLPKDVSFSGKGNPLESADSFKAVVINGKTYRRETDTMDTFFDSSWYFFRYCDSKNTTLPFKKEKSEDLLPVDHYIGGIEHAVLHLLYARFFTKVLRDLGLTDVREPFTRLLCQGMVIKDGAKMSKSLGNTVDPAYIISKYGADTARMFILFGAPVERDLDWSDSGVEGAYRFLKRVYRLVVDREQFPMKAEQKQLDHILHKTIKAVSEDIERFSYNTAISRLMECVNELYQIGVSVDALKTLLRLLAPLAPFMTEELWQRIAPNTGSVHQQAWPNYNEALASTDTVTVVFQVNGKVRDKRDVEKGLTKEALQALAMDSERVKAYLADGSVRQVIVIPDKLVNVVVA